MPAQNQELRKNYIGIISDKVEEQHLVESAQKSDHRFKNYFLSLMARILNR